MSSSGVSTSTYSMEINTRFWIGCRGVALIVLAVLSGCASNPVKDPVLTVSGETQEMVHQKLGEPVTSGVLKEKSLSYEVYWRKSYHSKDWSGDRSAWVVLYRPGAGAEVHEGFDDLEPDVREPIKQAYNVEIRRVSEKNLGETKS